MAKSGPRSNQVSRYVIMRPSQWSRSLQAGDSLIISSISKKNKLLSPLRFNKNSEVISIFPGTKSTDLMSAFQEHAVWLLSIKINFASPVRKGQSALGHILFLFHELAGQKNNIWPSVVGPQVAQAKLAYVIWSQVNCQTFMWYKRMLHKNLIKCFEKLNLLVWGWFLVFLWGLELIWPYYTGILTREKFSHQFIVCHHFKPV